MTSSVDRLFENESDVFISSNYNDFNQGLPSIQEVASVQSKSPEPHSNASIKMSNAQLSDSSAGRESPSTAASTAKSSRRDSLSDKVVIPTQSQIQQQNVGKQQVSSQQSSESSIPGAVREFGKGIAFEIPKGTTSGSSSNR